ncbi:hypothetical protein FACS1894170_13200 [Planctomycetales bacterium]|nr:hypothetical protein FACS1894170_13200 [Planctomycetales bacterium]
MYSDPLAFLLTFTTYGTWLHGSKKGSVDPLHNKYGEDFVEDDTEREKQEFAKLKHQPVYLTSQERETIEAAIREACEFRHWHLLEINVRTNHVHVVVHADETPKKIIEKLKMRATTMMNEKARAAGSCPRTLWTRGGSGRYLWNETAVQAACQYVREQDKQHKL